MLRKNDTMIVFIDEKGLQVRAGPGHTETFCPFLHPNLPYCVQVPGIQGPSSTLKKGHKERPFNL